jgi:hypothetical protein
MTGKQLDEVGVRSKTYIVGSDWLDLALYSIALKCSIRYAIEEK